MKDNKLEKIVFGLLGQVAINSNYNGDFSGTPAQHGDTWVAHDTVPKYSYKIEAQNRGKSILGLKSTYIKKDNKGPEKICCRTQDETFEFKTGKEIKKLSDTERLNEFFKFDDIKQFGLAVPFAIQGVVQINDAINVYDDTELCEETILAPYASGSGKGQATNGIRSYLDEAHFVHDFVINPNNIKLYTDTYGDEFAYTEENYEEFKDIITCCVTNYNSKTKMGCSNEFALFIEMKDLLHGNMVGTLNRLVEVTKDEEDMVVIDLSKVITQLEKIKDYIDKIEIQFDPYCTKVNFPMEFKSIKLIDIISKEEIKHE
ncbi:type I CRISPR-associated protein Cas7 [Clostridium ihumii]|uniref:type I CRISPR-associated protein Cas7 n=1 Tax=Clostridium ihumii TaxID=1470356 RepID=UPI003D336F0A